MRVLGHLFACMRSVSLSATDGSEVMCGLGWKGPFKIIYFHPPCYRQGHLPLDQVSQSPIQSGLEPLQGGGIHILIGFKMKELKK